MSLPTWTVLTTIHVPTVLESYLENCATIGHKDVHFVIVGDLKTPVGAYTYLDELKKKGAPVHTMTPLLQEEW